MWEIFDISLAEIEMIRDLWDKNRLYHQNSSEFFGNLYRNINFDNRMKAFTKMDNSKVKITVAKEDGFCIGYCISTIIEDCGEVQSVHVEQSQRGNGLGKQLVQSHIDWLRDKECSTIGVTVSQENENTIAFYKKLGFYPNTLYMQQK